MQIVVPEIETYAEEHSAVESKTLRDIARFTSQNLEYDQMLSGRVVSGILKLLVRLTAAKHILELGMFTGYSALSMAEELPADGKVITCDNNHRYITIARKHFDQSPHGGKIEIREGNALETLDKLNGKFDLVFLDADKENYPEYYENIIPKIRMGGIMVIDNVLWSGQVLTPDDRKATAIDSLNKRIREDVRVVNVLLTVRDGLNIIQKIS